MRKAKEVKGWLALAELEHLRTPGLSTRAACKEVAPQLDMDWRALEQAYYRAQRKAKND